MARKDYQIDEVANALNKKGCVITHETPITKSVKDIILPDATKIEAKYQDYVQTNLSDAVELVNVIGETRANATLFERFQNANISLFETKEVRKTVVVQPAYTVNVRGGHELGNGSWGKIDFLLNHCDYSLMK